MEGYARKFTGLKGGNCFVGFFKEGKPDGKLEVIDKDGYIIKQGIYNDSECVKEIEINNFTTRIIKTGKDTNMLKDVDGTLGGVPGVGDVTGMGGKAAKAKAAAMTDL